MWLVEAPIHLSVHLSVRPFVSPSSMGILVEAAPKG